MATRKQSENKPRRKKQKTDSDSVQIGFATALGDDLIGGSHELARRKRIDNDGPALVNNTMSVNDLAPALLALGKLLEEANQSLNDGAAKIQLNVKGSFKTGCFGIELDVVQSLAQQIGNLFSNTHISTAKEILEWLGLTPKGAAAAGIGGLLWLLKKLRGRSLKSVTLLDNGRVRFILDKEELTFEQ